MTNDQRYSKLLFAQIYIQMNNDFVAIRQLMNGMADLLWELVHKGHPERENDLLQVL